MVRGIQCGFCYFLLAVASESHTQNIEISPRKDLAFIGLPTCKVGLDIYLFLSHCKPSLKLTKPHSVLRSWGLAFHPGKQLQFLRGISGREVSVAGVVDGCSGTQTSCLSAESGLRTGSGEDKKLTAARRLTHTGSLSFSGGWGTSFINLRSVWATWQDLVSKK